MNLEDERRLKFDRRLRGRRGLVTPDELRTYEESLADSSDKIAPNEEPPPSHPETEEQQ
jgi:hypothetical protein